MEIELSVSKRGVMAEVAQTTAYTGAKMGGDDADALDRISTVDEDESQLERFWNESRSEIGQELRGLIGAEGLTGDRYELVLNVSGLFDRTLQAGMEIDLFSFFVQNITAKWYVFTNKSEAGAYADKAQMILDDLHRKAVYKKRPRRPVY